MEEAIHIPGEYCISETRQVLMQEQLHIPGLHLLGHYHLTNADIPLISHYHKNLFEITYIVSGIFSFSVEEKDYRLSGGDIFITKPDEIHSSNLIPLSVGEMYWLLLDCTKTEGLLFLDRYASEHLLEQLFHVSGYVVKADTKLMGILLQKAMESSLHREDPYTEAAYLSLFLRLLLDYSTKDSAGPTADIEAAVSYIKEHIEESLTLEELALLCNLSVSQFKHKFRAQTGVSPRNYINLQKVECAKSLLLGTQSVTDISMNLGFTTSSYFSTVFKRYTTYTPQEYRNRNT